MKIAMVGANDPLSFDDLMRLDAAGVYLPFPRDNETLDIINLNNGRDFLMEKHTYGIVILHSIFHPKRPDLVLWDSPGTRISPHHSVERWRTRLCETRAKIIVVWELLPATLNGWELDQLDGYKIHHRDSRITVYRRLHIKTEKEKHV
jgi:hypothetical protein